ncbi:uncharacterized protein LOC117895316 [Drosophila subobscura]|uniref:uncharacterized protein LOC117895316 n=1 Tax=Drosophila subobscura TaxID=7241 RepID=UPI00155A91B8|nr:uncharacterized protein LOC117895316 [Drosophila subobscura]
MCSANQFFQAKTFCHCLSLRTACIVIALFSDLLGIVSLACFFGSVLDGSNNNTIEEIFDVFWGVLHFVAANCLSLSLLMKSATPILVYIVTEALFLAFTVIDVPLSTAMGSNRQVNRHPEHCVLYWIFVCMTFVLLPYFLYITISVYLDKRQRLRENPQQD